MRIETDERPSNLEERLEAYRDPETGHILISPEEAEHELFKSLLSVYRKSVEQPASEVEVLAQIAEAEGERFDFTEALEKFENKRAEQERQVRETLKFAGTLPSRPPVREI